MITFFSILFVLLAINILLVVFSLRKTKSLKKPFKNIYGTSIPKLYPEQYSEAEYKKAV